MSLNALLHIEYAQHVSGTSMLIIRSSRLYACCYRLWCAVLGCWLSGVRCRTAGYDASRKRDVARLSESCNIPLPWRIACCLHLTTSNQALNTIGGKSTHIVSRSWWWAYKCPKHVEHIISAIKHSVVSSWFFFSTHMSRCKDKHTTSFNSLINIPNLSTQANVFIIVCLKRTSVQILRLSNKCKICAGTSSLISFPQGWCYLSRYQSTSGPCYEVESGM